MRSQNNTFGAWALVTGAGSGIGAAFCSELAAQGYNLVLVGRREDALQKTADRVGTFHPVATRVLPLDLTDTDFLERLAAETADLDIGLLVSNAGDDAMGALLRIELPRLKRMLKLNTETHLELTHYFGRRFEKRGRGGILLVSSTAGLQGTPFLGNYAGSKAYMLNLGLALNYEMKGTGVHVTVLLPGPTKTPGLLERPDIPLHKLPAPQMAPKAVARTGLKALEKNKPYVVAGTMNQVMSRMGAVMGRVQSRNMWGGLLKGIVPENLRVD